MSAVPVPPLPPSEEQPPREPSHRPARWKKILAWAAGIIAAIIVLVVAAVVVLLHSGRFQRYVLATAEQKISASLGTNVTARNFALSWSGISPSVDLYNVAVAGAPPYTNPPLLTIDHIHVAVKVTSLLHRTWYIDDIRVDHPVVRAFVDRHGTNNLPTTKSTGNSKSSTNVFDLGIRHALLDRGEVYYNNRKSVLDADLHDLTFRSGFTPAQKRYSGILSYRNGHLRMGTFNPIPHDLDARWSANPNAFTLEHAVLRSGRSQFVLTATLSDYAQPQLRANYDATVDTGEFRRIMNNPSLPAGMIRMSGNMRYASRPDVPLMAAMTINGEVASRALAVKTSSFRGNIRNLGAQYALANGNLDIRNIHAALLGGEVTGTMIMNDITGATRSHLTAALRGVSLAQLKSRMTSPAMQKVALTGSVNATADASWGKTTKDFLARTDADLHARMAPSAGGSAIPLDGVVHARYSAPAKQVTLTQSFVRTPQTSLTMNGTVSDRSALAVRLRSNDLHELETVAQIFQAQPKPMGLYGTASFNGAVRGSTAAPQITGQLNAANLKVKGSSWRVLRTKLSASPSGVALQNGQLQPADRGNITFNLRAGLHRWSFTAVSPFQIGLNASHVNIADLTRLAGSRAPVTGTLNARISANGTERSPMGNGTVSLTQAKVSSQPLQAVNVKFNGTGNEVHANLNVQIPKAGAANAVLTYYPKQEGYIAQLRAVGIQLAQLQAIKDKNLGMTGVLNLTASGQGTLKNPGLQATAQIPQLQVHNQTISGLTLQAAVANHVANYTLDSQVVNTYVRSRGTVQLTGAYFADATFDTQAIPLAPLVAAYAPSQAGNITGQTEIHATLHGPLRNKSQLEAHVIVPQLNVAYKNTVQLAAVSPIHVDFANGVLDLQRSTIRGTDTDLQFQGSIPTNSGAPASLMLVGTVNLQLAQLFTPDITSSGQLRFNINSYGNRANPNVLGQVRIVNAGFASGSMPIGLQNGNGVLTLTKDRLDITSFQGTMGGGTVQATGGVVYRPALRFDLGLAAEHVRVLYNGIRAQNDARLALAGTTQNATLSGQVRIEQLSFTPDFDLMDFMGQLGGGAATPPPAQGFSTNLKMNLGLVSNGINLVSRELSIAGTMNLRVQGTAAQPVILGRVNLADGDLIFNGNRYVLQGGTVDFVNPYETQPVVNVSANTTIQQYNIQMRFWGPADHLHTNYASDPALPPADIINLIAFGKTTEASAANPTPPGSLGAESLIASQVSSQVTSRVAKIAGISQLSIDPVLGGMGNGSTQTPGARITVQQRVTSKIFVTFSSDVTSTQDQVVELQYQPSRKHSYSIVRDQNGGFTIDNKFHKVW